MAVGDTSRLGYVGIVGLAPEVTLGTHVTATSFIEFNSESLVKNRTEQKLESISMSRNFKKRVMLDETIEGSVEFDMNVASDFCVWVLTQAMGGTVAASTIVAGCIKHTLNEGDMESNKFSATAGTNTTSLSFSVRKGGNLAAAGTATGDIFQYNGMRVNTLSLKAEVGGLCVATAEMIGKTMTLSSDSLTASFSTVVPLDFTNVTIKTGDSITNVNAESFQSFELTINNNLAGDTASRNLGSPNVGVLPPTRREVILSVTQRWDTSSNYLRFTQETATAFQILIDSGSTIAAGGTTYSMFINLPKCYINSPAIPEIGDMGVVSQDLEWSVMEDSEQGYAIQMTAFNATADYN